MTKGKKAKDKKIKSEVKSEAFDGFMTKVQVWRDSPEIC